MRRVYRVKDLRNQIGTPGPREGLFCPICLGEWSANRGDYFATSDNTVLRCTEDWSPLILGFKRITIVPIKEVHDARRLLAFVRGRGKK